MAKLWGRIVVRIPGAAVMRAGVALAVGLLSACSEVGPVFPTSQNLDAWVTAPETVDPASDRAPNVAGQVVTFRLARGERRSALQTGREWGLEQSYLFGFDIRLDQTALPRKPMVISRFLRSGATQGETELFAVMLDSRRGLSVMGRTCIKPEDLVHWHSVEMRIELADDDSGFLEVFCDRRPTWVQSRMRTTLPPTCRRAEGCTKPVPRPVQFEWQIGLIPAGQAAGDITVQMKRIFYHRLFVIPNRITAL